MPRYHVKTTNRVFIEENMKKAVEDVINNCGSLREVAARYSVTKSRLANYVSKARALPDMTAMSYRPQYSQSLIFTPVMEDALARYLLHCQKLFHGLTPKKTRELAYEFAVKNSVRFPDKWHEKKIASEDWFTRFMKSHPRLAIRKPEATSLARMTAFNEHSVGVFFDKLEEVMKRFNVQAHAIYNLDETGVNTVPPVQRIVGMKGIKQIGQVTSRERGESITVVGIISADGNALPPIFVFPRVRLDERKMLANTSVGCKALVHSTGYMTSDNFIHVLKFLCERSRPTKESPILILMDNHESHISLEAINFCRDNGAVILTLPPHTSHRLQPLDVSVFGPFKKFIAQGVQQWMLNHPNTTISIYDLPELSCDAWNRAASRSNVMSGFKKCGIAPFNRNIFQKEDFLSSYVSDRPAPGPSIAFQPIAEVAGTLEALVATNTEEESRPSPGSESSATAVIPALELDVAHTVQPSTPALLEGLRFYSPEDVWPYPKAQPRKEGKKRRSGKCMIATDTPEKIEKELQQLGIKKKAICRKLKFKKPKIVEPILPDSSGGEDFLSSEENSEADQTLPVPTPTDNIKVGQFVAFQYNGEIFPGKILKIEGSSVYISSMEKTKKAWRWPTQEDVLSYEASDVVGLIGEPKPLNKRGFFTVREIL